MGWMLSALSTGPIDLPERYPTPGATASAFYLGVIWNRTFSTTRFSGTLAAWAEQEDKADELIAEKRRIVDAGSDSTPSDDLKPASGQIYNARKNTLSLTRCGNNAKAFMRDTLAPLVRSDMTVYQELKHDIFGTAADS